MKLFLLILVLIPIVTPLYTEPSTNVGEQLTFDFAWRYHYADLPDHNDTKGPSSLGYNDNSW